MSVGTFWAADFWAPDFWAPDFWGDLAPSAPIPTDVETDLTLERDDLDLAYAPVSRDLTFAAAAHELVADWDS